MHGIWKNAGVWVFAGLVGASCASNQERFSSAMEIESTDGIGKLVEAKSHEGSSAKPKDGYSLQWYSCTLKKGAPYIVMLNVKGQPFTGETCKQGLVQAFLQKDLNVLAVNRPGAGKSEGKEVLGDDASVGSLKSLLDAEKEQGKKIDALWGFEEASLLALRTAKVFPLKFLVVGNGIYDWDATLSEAKDPAFVSEMKALQGSDPRFAETRSVAWDLTGLPKAVYLYHMQGDPRYGGAQTEAFRAALAANQYKVKLIELKDEKAILTPLVHQSALMQIIQFEAPEPQ